MVASAGELSTSSWAWVYFSELAKTMAKKGARSGVNRPICKASA